MNIPQVSTIQGGARQSPLQQWQLISPVGEPPLLFYRRVFHLSLQLHERAERFIIDPSQTVLRASFQRLDFNAVNPAEPMLKAKLRQAGSTTVVVSLGAPRRATQVSLVAGKGHLPGSLLEIYRLDGEKVADSPTVVAALRNHVAAFDFTDADFAVRLKNPSGHPESLDIAHIAAIHIQSHPTGPRISLAAPDNLNARVILWQRPGEFRDAAVPSGGDANMGTALAVELQRLVDRSDAGNLDAALVVESDAPCKLDIHAFNVSAYFTRQAFASAQKDKQVIRFNGERTITQQLTVELPGNAVVKSATLSALESLRPERSGAHGVASASDATLLNKTGIELGTSNWVAQSLTLPEPFIAHGVSLGVMGLSDETELALELQEDWNGQPSGKKLCAGTIKLNRPGQHIWATLLFPNSVAIPPQPHWLMLKTTSGRALWLTKAGAASILRLEKSGDKTAWTQVRLIPNVESMYHLLLQNNDAPANGAQQSHTLAVGNHVVASTGANDKKTFDLAAALNTFLSDKKSLPLVSVPLNFTTGLPGSITVYPPRIDFDV